MLAGVLLVVAPIVVLVGFVRADLLWVVVVDAALWVAATAASRAAFAELVIDNTPVEHETPPPRRPFLIMNPRSGGGKVASSISPVAPASSEPRWCCSTLPA